jgi:hypothetical protein
MKPPAGTLAALVPALEAQEISSIRAAQRRCRTVSGATFASRAALAPNCPRKMFVDLLRGRQVCVSPSAQFLAKSGFSVLALVLQ